MLGDPCLQRQLIKKGRLVMLTPDIVAGWGGLGLTKKVETAGLDKSLVATGKAFRKYFSSAKPPRTEKVETDALNVSGKLSGHFVGGALKHKPDSVPPRAEAGPRPLSFAKKDSKWILNNRQLKNYNGYFCPHQNGNHILPPPDYRCKVKGCRCFNCGREKK